MDWSQSRYTVACTFRTLKQTHTNVVVVVNGNVVPPWCRFLYVHLNLAGPVCNVDCLHT